MCNVNENVDLEAIYYRNIKEFGHDRRLTAWSFAINYGIEWAIFEEWSVTTRRAHVSYKFYGKIDNPHSFLVK